MQGLKTSFRTLLIIGICLGFVLGSFASAWKLGTDNTGQIWGWTNNDQGYITTNTGKGYPPTTAGLQAAVDILDATGGIIYGNNAQITLSTFILIDHSNIHLQDFRFSGNDGIYVYANGVTISNISLKNIYTHTNRVANPTSIYFYAEASGVFKNIIMDNIYCDGGTAAGIWFNEKIPNTNCKLIDASILNCKVQGGSSDSYFLGTQNNTNVLYQNDISLDAQDCGFSTEYEHISKNVQYVSCSVYRAGNSATFHYYANGFLMGQGATLTNCYTEKCYEDAYLFGSDSSFINRNVTTINNCVDNNSRTSLYISHDPTGVRDGSVIINGFTSKNSSEEAIRIIGQHIYAKNLVVINPGYNKTWHAAVVLGGLIGSDKLYYSDIDISIHSYNGLFGGNTSIFIHHGESSVLHAFIDNMNALYGIDCYHCGDLTLTDIHINSAVTQGIRISGSSLSAINIMDTLIEDYRTHTVGYGVYNAVTDGNFPYVQSNSVVVKDAGDGNWFYNCKFFEGNRITNSRGNTFGVTQSGLQQSIWDLNSSGGGWVELPVCNISITSTVYITSNVWLRGTGNTSIIYLANSANTTMIRNTGGNTPGSNTAYTKNQGIHISDLRLEGNSANQPIWWKNNINAWTQVKYLIQFTGTDDCLIENVYFNNAHMSGIMLNRQSNSKIRDCVFKNMGTGYTNSVSPAPYTRSMALWFSSGITIDNATNITISGCHIDNVYCAGILSQNLASGVVKRWWNKYVSITGCIITRCNFGVYTENAKYGTISNCIISDCTKSNITNNGVFEFSYGIDITATTYNIIISGCMISRCGNISGGSSGGNYLISGLNSTITDSTSFRSYGRAGFSSYGTDIIFSNLKSDNETRYGIYAYGGYSLIIGCSIYKSGLHGIYSSTSSGAFTTNHATVISGCTINTANGEGIWVEHANTTIIGNSIYNVLSRGIYVYARFCTVSDNVIGTCGSDGIQVKYGNCTIMGNNINNCNANDGIQLSSTGGNNTVMGNRISGCTIGINEYLNGDANIIIGNVCFDCASGIDKNNPKSICVYNSGTVI